MVSYKWRKKENQKHRGLGLAALVRQKLEAESKRHFSIREASSDGHTRTTQPHRGQSLRSFKVVGFVNTTTLYEISANNLFKAGEIMMQDILKRLEQTRNELTQIIEQVPVHLFNHLEREGAWSIGQVCQHLVMTELLFIKG